MATFVDVIPPLVENTIMRQRINDATGAPMTYRIKPVDGYILHDNLLDHPEVDEDAMMETGVILLGYSTAEMSAGVNYDWDNTTTIDGYTAYGARQFFARPISEVPDNQIFSNDPDHEVM